MDKRQARQTISELFTQPFDRGRYQHFLRNLLNNYEARENKYYKNARLWDKFWPHINHYERIGKYTDPDGNRLDLLIVEVPDFSKLERARTTLRNLVVKHLKTFGDKDYALVAFYAEDDQGADWRFSFIKIEHEAYKDEKGKVKTKQELTPAKRYSYLVGVHENSHTASQQLLPLLEMDYADPRIEEIEAAFGIEKVTSEFFEQYKALFQNLAEHLKSQPLFNKLDGEQRNQQVSRFAKKLLGQIVFLYFLQKKGWLGVKKDKAWGTGSKRFMRERYDQVTGENGNYYHDFLQYLFYEALADERKGQEDPGYYIRFDCRVPFLNGGLFEPDYKWQDVHIDLPNTVFHNKEKNKSGDIGTGVLDVFDRYNFTIKEDEPLEKEVAVDPEMLGKVFENMLEVTERKSKGAFYTPREIVHYMCQESLIHYLDNRLNCYASTPELSEPQTDIFGSPGGQRSIGDGENIKAPKVDLETLIRKGHLALENDQRVLNKGKETDTYRFQLPGSVRQHAKDIDEALTDIKVCDPAIGSGAFPLGLLHEIVNTRLALAPHSKNSQSAYELKRHAIGESLYGVDTDASAIDIARLRLWLSLIVDEEDYDTIEALPNLDYKIVQGDSLIGFPENWKSPAFNKIEELKNQFFEEKDHDKKMQLKVCIDSQIQKRLADSKRIFGWEVNFDFRLFFSEVWHYKSGFDLVIGNPPYVDSEEMVRQNADRETLRTLFSTTKGNWDLFVPFIEKGVKITNKGGTLSFIVPNKLISAKYADKSRALLSGFDIHEIRDYSKLNVFREVDVYPITFVLTKRPFKTCSVEVAVMEGLGSFENINSIPVQIFYRDEMWSKYFFNKSTYELIEKLDEFPRLKTLDIEIIGAATVGEAYEIKKVISEDDGGQAFKFINTGTIDKYATLWGVSNTQYIKGSYVKPVVKCDQLKKISKNRYQQSISQKIVVAGMSKELEAYFDAKGEYCAGKTTTIILTEVHKLPVIMSILNSELAAFYVGITYHSRKMAGGYINIGKEIIGQIPVPDNLLELEAFGTSSQVLVNWLQYINESSHQLIFTYIKQLLDGLVYELYFTDEIKAANKEILPHLGELPPISDDMAEEVKLAIIQREFDRLYDPRHPVRNNLETLDSVEVIKTIREALKK